MEIISIKSKTTKEKLVDYFTHKVGGVASYWNEIPIKPLSSLYEAVKDNDEAKAALANLVNQLQKTKQTNSRLNKKNFGLDQTAKKNERSADRLTKMNALLEQQKNDLLRQIQDMVSCLKDYEKSEISQAVKAIRNHINSWIK